MLYHQNECCKYDLTDYCQNKKFTRNIQNINNDDRRKWNINKCFWIDIENSYLDMERKSKK
jgi:hypothetical protein